MNNKMAHIGLKGAFLLLLGTFAVSGIAAHPGSAQEACSSENNVIPTNYSLYYEYYRNNSFSEALPYLRWILTCAPGYPNDSDRNYRRAVEVYEGIGMEADDPDMKRTYLDSALYIYDTAVTKLEDAGVEVDPFEWTFEKGRFIQEHAAQFEELQQNVAPIYRQAFNMDPSRIQPYYINYIVNDLVSKDQKTEAIDFMEQAEEAYPGNQEIKDMLDSWRGRLFTSPEERIEFLEGQLAEDPDNLELIHDLFDLYSDEEMRDKVYEMGERMMELDPTARTYRQIAKMRLDDGDTEAAIDLYNQSLELPGGQDAAREVHYNIGIAHQQEGRLSRARTEFRAALRADPNYGPALISIGELYMAAVSGCDTFEREDRAVYWLAADYFDRAARVDDNVAAAARSHLSSIRSLFPNAEDKFFKNWNKGDNYEVNYGCYTWINETTRIR